MDKTARPKKSLGQNFLIDENVAGKIIDAAELGPEDEVIEIGPGKGVLTGGLARLAGHVTAIELDDRLFADLKRGFAGTGNVDVVLGDALGFPFERLAGKSKVVANLPYNISTPIITRLVASREKFSVMVLMLQKEVAHRICAPPGGKEYGYLSVMVQLYTDARVLFGVPAGAFRPVPKVDSAVVRLTVLERPAAPCRDYALMQKVVSAAFAQRRKTLKNTLKSSRLFPAEAVETLGGCGIDPARRAETLSVAEFAVLTDFLFEFAHKA